MPQYKEQWSVYINRKEFILNEVEKPLLEKAMTNGDRWFKTQKGDILSVNHIESVVLNDRQIKNQLEEGQKWHDTFTTPEMTKDIRKKIRDQVKGF